MIIVIPTEIFVEVTDEAQASEATESVDGSLRHNMSEFPHGDVIQADAPGYRVLTDEEIQDKGFTE